MSERIQLLDFIRSAAIVVMLLYHFVYDLAIFGLVGWDFVFSPVMNAIERVFASLFIFTAGFSSRLSRSNTKRGVLVLACGLVVSLCSSFADVTIRFGVLELLGWSMIIYGVCAKALDRLPPAVVTAVCVPVFCAGYYIYRNVRVASEWLFPFGLRGYSFASADYFPLLPWFFMFLLGVQAARVLLAEKPPGAWARLRFPRALTWPGRHSLIIYLAHQPLLYPIAWGISLALS